MLRSKFERKTFKLLIGGIRQAMLAVCRGISLKQIFKLLIGGNTASTACSIQGYKYDNLMYECITYYIYSSCFDPGIIIFKLYICGEAADDG